MNTHIPRRETYLIIFLLGLFVVLPIIIAGGETGAGIILVQCGLIGAISICILLYFGIKNEFVLHLLLLPLFPFQAYYLFKRPFAFTFFNCLLILLSLVVFLKRFERLRCVLHTNDRLLKIAIYSLFLIMFTVVASFFYHPSDSAIKIIFTCIGICLLIMITMGLIDRQYRIDLSLNVLILVGVSCALNSILVAFHVIPVIGYIHPDRFDFGFMQSTGIIGTRGTYGMLLNAGFAISFIRLIRPKQRMRSILTYSGSLIILFVGIVFSQSRSTYLAFLVCIGLLLSGVFTLEKKSSLKLAFLSFSVLAVVISAFFFSNKIEDVADYLYWKQERGAAIRIDVFENTVNELAESMGSFLLGTGRDMSAMEIVFWKNAYVEVALHNGFAVVATYGGILLLVPYGASILCAFVMLLKINKHSREKEIKRLVIGLFAALAACFIELNFYMGYSEKVLWYLIGISYAIYFMNLRNSPIKYQDF